VTRTVRINATLDERLLARIDAFADSRLEDRSTALRQLADFALREMALREALEAYRTSRLTLRELADALAVDVWKAHDLLRANGIAVAQGTAEETADALHEVLDGVRKRPSSPPTGRG